MFFKYIYIACAFCLFCAALPAQNDAGQNKYGRYYFDDDAVVFEFDVRAYVKAMRAAGNETADFADLKIAEIAVSGDFNNWSKDGWKMERTAPHRYRLRKKLEDFTDAPNWQFKFVINGQYWSPAEDISVKQGALGRYDTSNPRAPQPKADTAGNAIFRLEGFPNARKVIVCGTFNNWNEGALRMKRVGNAWETRIALSPGLYEYKFVVDGKWMEDPANPEKRRNQYDTFNSVLRIQKSVSFSLAGYAGAKKVVLSGSFNQWNETALSMTKTSEGWEIKIPLTGGKHLYKFIVDGVWMLDPLNKRTEKTWDGYVNSVLLVH